MRVFQFDDLQDPEFREYHFDSEIGDLDIEKFDRVSRKVIVALQRLHFSTLARLHVVAAVAVSVATQTGPYYFTGNSLYSVNAEPGMLLMGNNHVTLWLIDPASQKGKYRVTDLFHDKTIPLCEGGNGGLFGKMAEERLEAGMRYIVREKRKKLTTALAEATTLQAEIESLTSEAI
ncbi:MAG TPA: hypothetical protein VMR46_02215 [Candidatus Paceibacterota bacterium]|jgi:hypothetical protein|nr:hypothetical protein [Candidatus Paceibacterota bacterium]